MAPDVKSLRSFFSSSPDFVHRTFTGRFRRRPPPKTPPNILFVNISNSLADIWLKKFENLKMRHGNICRMAPIFAPTAETWTFEPLYRRCLNLYSANDNRSEISRVPSLQWCIARVFWKALSIQIRSLKMVIFGILTKVALFGRRFKALQIWLRRCERRRWREQEQ